MVLVTLAVAAGLVSTVAAKTCQNFTVPVTITSRNAVLNNFAVPSSPLDASTFALNITRQGGNATAMALTGYATISGTYNISAQWCTPNGQKSTGLQILTHGIGFDKTYWDLAFNSFSYSYVNTALSQGYDTFAYDRLGIGNSSHGDPRNEIQSFLEVAALAELTRQLRNGTISTIGSGYQKIVHVGHSFGSAQTYALVNQYPTISDGIVLTGFSMNSSFVPLFGAGNNFVLANTNQPFRLGNQPISEYNQAVQALGQAGISAQSAQVQAFVRQYGLTDYLAVPSPMTAPPLNYPDGYLANRDVNALQYLFLLPNYFDMNIAYYGEQGKQPVTIGEALTLGSIPMMNKYAGPVLVFTGSNDLPYCGGDCLATGGVGPSIPAAVSMNFPSAKAFTAYIQPNSGHGLNFHYNATAGYSYIQNWLKTQGL